MKKSSLIKSVFLKALPALLFMLALIIHFASPAAATTFTKTVPGTSLTIPTTYPEAGGVVIVLTGANGNVYYQFINPSTMFVGYQNTGTPTAYQGNPFQIGPQMVLNCGAISTCSTYLGGSITSMAIRFTALDGDNKAGEFDFNDLTLRINGTDVGNWSTIASQTTNTAGTTLIGSGVGFGNNTLDTGWFQSTNSTLLANVLSTGRITATVFDRDPNDNYWDFRSGNDAAVGTVPLTVAPGVTLDKAVNPGTQTTFLNVGQVINYTYAYQNIGSVYVENIAVTDDKIASVVCPATPARLQPGETKTCTGSYTVTQADFDAGKITNIATATGTPQAGSLGPVTDTVTITGPASAPFVNLIKIASGPTFGAAGTSVSYFFQVQNTGNVTLSSVVITDPLLPSLSCTVVPITPGATVNATCTGNTKTVTVADVDANVINNTASMTARAPNGVTVNDTASASMTGPTRTPGIALRKITGTIADTNGNGRLDAGDTQNYDLIVTNTGNVTLTAVSVSDPGSTVTGGPLASLAPGVVNSTTFKASRIITLKQMNAGSVLNQASVSSTPPAGVAGPTTDLSHPTSDTLNASTVSPLARAPAITLAKTATQTSFSAVGNTINYSYLVRNTGNVTLTVAVTIADNKIPAAGITCPAFPGGGLIPNATYTCTGIYTIVQADLDAGKVTNIASAASGTVATPVVTSPTDTVTVNASVSPGVTITKGVGTIADTNASGRTDAGDTVTYVITVANTGNVTLSAVTVSDPLPGATVTGSPLASLGAGTSNNTIRVNYILTQADVNAGKVDNQAAVTANPPSGPAVTDLSDPTSGTANSSTTTPVTQVPSIAITKATGTVADTNLSGRTDAGDIISNAITVRNTGTVTLTGIIVTDPKTGVTLTGANVGTLLPGATSTGPITASYTLTQADIDAGSVQNQASVSGTPPSGAPATDTSHPTLFTANGPTPTALTTTGSIAVVKTAGMSTTTLGALPTATDAGDRITYSFTVTNTGAQTLNTVGVTDPKLTGINCAATTLAPNASTTCSAAPYTLTLADMNAGSVTNQATASGTRPGGATVTDLSGSTNANNTQTVTSVAATPRIALIKTGGTPTTALGSNTSVTDPGDTISYSFTATNTGSVTLNSLAVTDAKVSGITCAATTLAPGISTNCSGTPYVLTLADLNAGQVDNQATASALSPGGATTTDTSDPTSQTGNAPTQTPVTQTPRVALLKIAGAIIDSNFNGRQDAGDRIPYTFTVTNTGTVTLTNIRVADPQIPVAGTAITSLAPGASNNTNFTAVRVLTQADIDAGNYTNQAVVTAVSPSGPITDNSDPSSNAGNAPTLVPIAPQRALSVAKTANVSSFDAPGTVITYAYEITNSGTITLSQPFAVSDNKIPSVVCPATPATLGPTQSLICTANYITTQADVDAGGVTNIASATSGSTTSPNDSVTVPAVRTPGMEVVKTAAPVPTSISSGDTVNYEYKITNTGNVTLTQPFTVNDNRISSASIACLPGDIGIGESKICTGSYIITGDDILVAVVTNTASISNSQFTSPVTSATIPEGSNPALDLTKTAITTSFGAVGDPILYEYTVVNSGNTDFARVIDIIDNKAGTFVCLKSTPSNPFKRGQKTTCTVSYAATQADLDAGFVTNDAVASTLFGASLTPVASNPATAIVDGSQDRNISVTKNANSGITGVGQVLTYTMNVANAGNVTLSNIVITDPLIPTLNCTIAVLAPGNSNNTCSGTYQVTQADIDRGTLTNTVTAEGIAPQGQTVTNTGSNTITAPAASPSLSIDKIANELTFDSIGQDLTYSFTVKNTGNVTLTNVTVTDPLVPAFSCVIPALAPGITDATSCATTYRVTQADVDNGSIINTASATGTPARGTPPTATDSVTTGGPTRQPSIAIVKSTASTPNAAGQTLGYKFEVFNTGNVNITGVTVTDPKCATAPVKVSGDTGNDNILGINEVHVYTCTSIGVTQVQVDAGVVSNTVTANATSIVGPAPTATSNLNTPVTSSPAITLVKTGGAPTTNLGANNTTVDAGDSITYSFTLANAGNVTLNPVSVTDAKVGTVTCAATSLAPGVSTNCTAAAYTITQADMDAGAVTNTATGRGKPPTGADTTDVSGSNATNNTPTVTTLTQLPAITLVKTAGAPSINLGNSTSITDAGDRITYSFTVRNAGNVTLNPISVADPKLTSVTCGATSLAPGASTACTSSPYVITQADMDAGLVTNTATATGKPPTGANVTDVSGTLATNDTPTTRALPQSPIVRLTKVAAVPSVNLGANASVTDAGDTITYAFTVRNSGSVTLTTISVTDLKVPNIVCAATTLAPAIQTNCTAAAYTITQADMDAGSVTNTANASAKPPTGANVTDISGSDFTNNFPTVVALTATPSLTLVKTAATPTVLAGTNTTVTDAGDTITYVFTVRNSGAVTLTTVGVTDAKVPGIVCAATSLAPGVSTNCAAAAYTITQTDMDLGSVSNSAVASGKPPTGANVTDTSGTDATNNTPTTTPLSGIPSVTLVKTAAAPTANFGANSTVTDAGDRIAYTFTVRNTGTVTLNPVSVTDAKVPAIICAATSLAPNVSTTCSGAAYVITQANMDAGLVTNTALVSGTPPTGAAVTDTSGTDGANDTPTTTPLTATPSLTLVKTSGIPTVNLGTNTTVTDAGDTITYAFAVRNSGTVTLNPFGVTDAKVPGIICAATSLAPGVSTTCSAPDYVITLADMNVGSVTNTATATGVPPAALGLPDATDISGTSPGNDTPTNTPITATPSLTLVKTASAPTVGAGTNATATDAGDTIAYSFTVRNSGTVTLNPVSVTDAKITNISCAVTSLAPGISTTCAGDPYIITLADMNAGSVTNTATASGVPPVALGLPDATDTSGTNPANDTPTNTLLGQTPSLTLVKTAAAPTVNFGVSNIITDSGDRIAYSFTVRNSGTVTLNSVGVTDPKVSGITCPATSLAPGVSTICTGAAYVITQSDMDAGEVVNTALASGTPPTSPAVTDVSGTSPTNDTPTRSPVTGVPSIALVKSAGVPTVNLGANATLIDAGDTIAYSFTVRNSGNVALSAISVADAKVTNLVCAATSLAPTVSTICAGDSYTLTQADMDAGAVTNTATATGTPPSGSAVTDISGSDESNNADTVTPVTATPRLTLVKTSAIPTIALGTNTVATDAGDTIAYIFAVRNSGTVTLNPVSVLDPQVTNIVCAAATLAPGVSTTCSGDAYVITLIDMDAGSVTNTATAAGKPPVALGLADATDTSGTSPSNDTPTNTPLSPTSGLTLVKSAGAPTLLAGTNSIVTDAGDTITYSFTVSNRGTVTLNPVSVSDVKLGAITCAVTSLAPGVSTSCSAAPYTLTLADMNAGSVTNTATASGTPPSGPAVTDVSGSAENNDTQTNTPLTQTPRLTLVKTAAAPTTNLGTNTTATDAGDTITYSFAVANTGTVTLNPLSVSDARLGTVTCAATSLAPGLSTSCTAPAYVITLADMNAGKVDNTATATGKPPTGADVTDISGSDRTNDTPTSTPLTATPSLTLVKTAGMPTVNLGSNATATDAGDTITYSFAVRNSGTVTLNPVSVTDIKLGTVTCAAINLAPNVSTICSAAPYVITLTDMNAGSVSNTATATGVPPAALGLPDATDVSGTSPANDTATNVPLTATPLLTLVKTAGVPTVGAGANATATDAGDTIAYSFTVRNSGTVTLNPVSVADAKITNISCAVTSLAPGVSTTCAGDPYIITLADMNAGSVTNTATASGVPPVALGLPDATDISGTNPANDTPTNTLLGQTPSLTLVKTTGTASVALGINPAATDAGDTIGYSFTVRNAGTVTLTGVAVNDLKVTNIVCAATILAPGVSTNCAGDPYIITVADMNAGQVTNTATGTGTPPSGPDVTDRSGTSAANDADTVTPLTPTPRLTLVKTAGVPTTNLGANATVTDAGDTVTYSFVVTNSGNVVLNPVSVTDAKLGTITCAATSLAPGASTNCTALAYVILLADMNAGSVTNSATATGTPPAVLGLPNATDVSGSDVNNDNATVTPLNSTPRLTLVKTAGTPTVALGANGIATDAGDTISYAFTVANTGTVTLNTVSVSDAKLGAITCAETTLAPGISTICSAPAYVITLADMNNGSITNTATVTGTPPSGANVTDVSGSDATNNTPTDTLLSSAPSLTLIKTAGTPTVAAGANVTVTDTGDTISYLFAVRNSGTVTLDPVNVSDPKVSNIVCDLAALAPSESTNCAGDPYSITLADMNAGSVTNTALASGTPPVGPAVNDTSGTSPANDTPTSTPLNSTPRLTLVKTAAAPTVAAGNDNTVIDAGDTITYSFAVANTGTVTLNPVSVSDVKLGATICAATSLAPGAATTCSAAPYVITLTDMNTGSVTNTATATGTPPTGPVVTDRSGSDAANDDDTLTPLFATPRVSLIKFAGTPTIAAGTNAGVTDAGDTIAYSFTVANTGSVTLNSVSVSDAKVANLTCANTILLPGVSTICTGDAYIITLDDMNAGSVVNTALATGAPPIGIAVTDSSGTSASNDTPTTTILTSIPSLTLVKSSGAPSVNLGVNAAVTDAGDTIAYSFAVANTGSVTLNTLTISDTKVSNIACAATSLAPGLSTTCTGNPYVLTQADMDAGSTTNTAVASGTPPTGPAVTDTSGTSPANDTPTETLLTGIPHLTLVKSAGAPTIVLGANATYSDAGDQVSYRFRVTNTGPISINSIVVTDAKVSDIVCEQTSLVSGASTQCAGNPYTITNADMTALRLVNTASVSGLSAAGARVNDVSDDPSDLANVDVNGDGDPDDATVLVLAAPTSGTITMQKTASLSNAKSGDVVVYTLMLNNSQLFAAGPLSVVDTLPRGFTFVDDSATSDSASVTPAVAGQSVTFSSVTVPANSSLSLRLSVRVGNVSSGAYTNRVRAFDSTGAAASNEATATVTISGEAVFDCGDIIGKVYDDKNRNNVQDKGEPGMPGVRLATVRGVLITTDQYGRYNVPCAELPDPDIGSNFIVKLDARTLPSGYVVITENPRDVRLTAGKLTKLNFGVAQARVLRVELTASAFEQGSVKPSDKLKKGIRSLVNVAGEELSVIQLTYVLKPAEPRKRAEERLKTVSDDIRIALKKAGLRAKTPVETTIITR